MAELREVDAAYAKTGARIFTSYILGFLAEGHSRAGDAAAGLEAIEQALQIAETTLDRGYRPELCAEGGPCCSPRRAARRRRGPPATRHRGRPRQPGARLRAARRPRPGTPAAGRRPHAAGPHRLPTRLPDGFPPDADRPTYAPLHASCRRRRRPAAAADAEGAGRARLALPRSGAEAPPHW
ncbi:MAG: hypothetical protein U0802_18645 [Candidatus Binatia bacterium]